MNRKVGTCAVCESSGVVIVKYLPSVGSLCCSCNNKRLGGNKSRYKSPPKRKPTGEGALFEAIWNTRKRVSFISGTPLGNEAKSWYFMHVLPKSTYPGFRLLDRNIVLGTFEEHELWDKTDRSKIKESPMWAHMFELEEKLKQEYNKH